MSLSFLNDLKSVFGSCPNMDVNSAASVSYVKNLNAGPSEVYFISIVSSAAVAGTFSLIDATASGTADTVKWQTNNLSLQMQGGNFLRPLYFSKGLQVTYSASGAATVLSNIQWSPRRSLADPFGR